MVRDVVKHALGVRKPAPVTKQTTDAKKESDNNTKTRVKPLQEKSMREETQNNSTPRNQMLINSLPYGIRDLRTGEEGYRKITLEGNTNSIWLMYWYGDQDCNTFQEYPILHESSLTNWLTGPSQKEALGPIMCRKIEKKANKGKRKQTLHLPL